MSTSIDDPTDKLSDDELEEAAMKVINNFGAPKDVWDLEYGQIFKDGKLTEAGIQWYQDKLLKEEESK